MQSKNNLDPLVQKYCLKLDPPGMVDNRADVERLKDALAQLTGEVEIPLELMRSLPDICRSKDWEITVAMGWKEDGAGLLAIEPGDTRKRNFGLAVDIGTTTVVVYLVDLISGKTLGSVSGYNDQIFWGEDKIGRASCRERV